MCESGDFLDQRNIIICQEVAVDGQFLPGKSNFFLKLPKKFEIFVEICLEKFKKI